MEDKAGTDQLTFLKARHQEIDDWVDNMATRKFLTPNDDKQVKIAKVRRLRLREIIDKLSLRELG
jgi:hypothetical protein